MNINDGTEEQDVESRIRISRGRVGGNVTGPVGQFKDSMSSDAVCKDEYSEDSKGSEDEFEKEMNPSETNLLKMNPSEINLSVKLLKKKLSLTPAEKQNKYWKIAMKRRSKELNRI